MALLYDARGNEITGSVLDQIGGGTVTDARTASATLSALNAEIVMDLQGKAVAAFDIRTGAMNATLVFEATVDGTNYFGLPGINVLTEAALSAIVITTTHAATYIVGTSGYRRIRCRVSAYTSGNVVVAARASVADFAIYAKPMPTLLWITATAAANTQATATLPAGGAGLFHYITYISCMRNATAALAGTATLIHTTTNLPGNPAWSVGNAMIAGGTQIDVDYQPASPLKCSVANTNTTVVMPAAGAAVLNRINVGYYLGA
jgi:hypothetical protein